jgi:predicted DNA-binding transcriptional regulator YafY
MSTKESLLRYFHITNKLRKSPATFNEIDSYLRQQSELQSMTFTISKRQFKRDLEDIGSIFEIEIYYDFGRRVYTIDEELQSEVSRRRLEAFDTFNALKIGENVSKSIQFENRRPQGTENLFGLLHAITNHLQVNFTYQKFWEDEPSQRTVGPVALKEFKNRWYLIATNPENTTTNRAIKTFGLDRLTSLEITRNTFKPPLNFDIEDYFSHCFGIIAPTEEKPIEVILSFDPDQGKYIKTLPLHHSQQIIVDNAEELRIKLLIYDTFDFRMELLAHGSTVTVLQPLSLAEEIRAEHLASAEGHQE